MISINSLQEPTKVINSRYSKKRPIVWRRRQGLKSGIIFTTYERPSLTDIKPIVAQNKTIDAFNLGRLILSVAEALSHNKHAAQYESLWLAQTIEENLIMNEAPLTQESIAKETYSVLRRFDALAALQYGARHGIISNVRKRGRPSLNESSL